MVTEQRENRKTHKLFIQAAAARNRRVVVTKNSIYHLSNSRVSAIYERRSGNRITEHSLLGRRISGYLMRARNFWRELSAPGRGGVLWFVIEGRDVFTSTIEYERIIKTA